MFVRYTILFAMVLLMFGSSCFGQQNPDKADYAHRSEYEALQQRLEQLEADRGVSAGGEGKRPNASETAAEFEGGDAERGRARAEALEPAGEKPPAAGLDHPKPSSFTPGFERARERRLAEPDKIHTMNAHWFGC